MENKINREDLRKPLPAEAVSQHPTKKFLSSIKAIYVTERLNDVFGIGGWKVENEIIEKVGAMIVVKAKFTIERFGLYIEQFGGNDNGGENSKNFDLGDAYKGACTDALTKIASYLEIGIDVFKGKQQGTPKKATQAPQTNVNTNNVQTPQTAQNNSNLGNCPICDAPMKLSQANKPYCSALCWKK